MTNNVLKHERNYKVYAHIVPASLSGYKYDKYYIGITCKDNVSDRWGNGSGYVRQPYFYNAILKYGWDNIEHRILFENIDKETAKSLEISLIDLLRTTTKDHGYNVSFGGESGNPLNNKNVYCVELSRAFKNSRVASLITGDSQKQISSACKRFSQKSRKNLVVGRKMKYTYCYIDDMWKLYKDSEIKMNCQSKPIIHLPDGKVLGSYITAGHVLGKRYYRRSIVDYDKYKYYEENHMLDKKDFIMYLNDYLKIFDSTPEQIA